MGAGFIRRYVSDPGLPTILEIEGVVIIDREPPEQTTGQGSGAVCLVAEFEDGPYGQPLELFSGLDFLQTFGSFGYSYDGVNAQNPCARSRNADAAITPEYWNGNGFIALSQKKFARLFCVRADTSVGAVSFTRLPSLSGNGNYSWALANGDTLIIFKTPTDIDTATFSGAAAVLTSATATYPTTFAGGESMNVTIDAGTPNQIGPVSIIFQAGDQSHAQVIARINATLGYTAASIASTTTLLTGRVLGNTGNVVVNSVSSGLVTTATGFSAASAAGTGNVGNLAQVSFNEVQSVITTASNVTAVDRDTNGNLRISETSGAELVITGGTAASKFGFPVNAVSREPDGVAFLYSTAGTFPTTFAGGETLTLGIDGQQNVTVVFQSSDTSQALAIARINAAFAKPVASSFTSTITKFVGQSNGGQIRIVAATALVLTALGITLGTTLSVGTLAGVILAGTRVRNSSGVEWVTTQSTAFTSSNSGPYSLRVRPGLDDGSIGSSAPNTVTVVPAPIPGAAFSVFNPLTIAAALIEGAIDAAYQTALDATISMTAVTVDTDLLISARQSNAIRVAGRLNALTASASTPEGRRFIMRPPLSTTTRAMAKSSTAQPGVGTYRAERVWYAFPGAHLVVPQIAALGTAGGAGFTADGGIDVGFDSFIASIASQIPPEENPGEETPFAQAVVGVEVNNPDVQKMTMDDYISFKASGIMALRIDSGTAIVQSGVSSVDPALHPAQAPASRQRFADFVTGSLATSANVDAKKPMTRSRRTAIFANIFNFLNTLKGNPGALNDNSRLMDFSIDTKNGNPQSALDAGAYRLIIAIKMNPDILDIILDCTIGTTVQITQTQ